MFTSLGRSAIFYFTGSLKHLRLGEFLEIFQK
ncbi:hypothetical protein CP_0300 [Chlamydia pneumoniae AR39]|uniref:Uncharacterized protein n=1 Tax=Chlamydia pneumoniae TaxID=83558 RepID=Q9K2A0_CHLPN|nr:hypothetical protein CP_0300 [Chlamydia pneumoniae AR39]